MISYAQNREDVLLNRLFPPGYAGFYIDIGANHPLNGSVTAHFSRARGWRGINVEPTGLYHDLVRERPRDVTLNCAVSNRAGTATFFAFPPDSGVSTFDPELAREAEARLRVAPRHLEVPVRTLAEICREHAPPVIDFLSIDVEGHERQVIEGADWQTFRPRVVLVEATEPHTTTPSHERWESLLLEGGYLFAAFDGLNRYYVRREEPAMVPLLQTPVNTLDGYVPVQEQRAIEEVQELQVRLRTLEALGPLTMAISRRLNRLETRFPGLSRSLHRWLGYRPRGYAADAPSAP
ncbi:MAG: FkbM family methyltransferase [Planctomycetaceae bacterium]